ncbi:ABC transporter ATP-binding protein [Thermodesulfobacterium sp. TA1]|uniref:ABC transporter ATP-binding protein n=1 Tax=Thermodesulfobacterium sp. TA1 TaxID=2234087 RepID=UPI001231C613|nr:ABC transporter ATP-binding protein [Thermodesulfobacterium sp. TA1]QER42228.1 ABC transporter ATP-binding protein [Thermodesulfobacterium sp. TA1]
MDFILQTVSLSKFFGSKKVLQDVSFELKRGDVLGVIGPNGAGKTTLLYLLLDVLVPTYGKIFYFGKDFRKHRAEILAKVGFASQYLSLPYSLTVEENLKVFGYFYKVPSLSQRIEELLALFKLSHKKKTLTRSLSSGEMMRLNLVRAFLHRPEIVYLDEPTAGLDPEYVKYVSQVLKEEVALRKTTIVLTSHQLGELERVANKILLLKQGRVVGFGELKHLLVQFQVESLEELYFKVFHEDGL